MNGSKISVLIPVFNLKDERFDNFKYILKKLVDSEITDTILVYEQKNKTNEGKTNIEQICNTFKHVKYAAELIDDTRIHKSFLINKGVNELDSEFIWVNDADCYIKFKKVYDLLTLEHKSTAEQLTGASIFVPGFKSILDTYDFIQPFAIAKRLNEEETLKLRNDESISVDFSEEKIKANKEDFIKLYGALSFIFRKSAFLEIGGMDETYTGWGLEDTDFCAQVYKYCTVKSSETNNIKILRIIAAVHLYHPMPSFDDRKDNCPVYKKNFKYFTCKHDMTYFKLKQLVESYHKKRPQITIINRPRTGSNCVKETLSDGLRISNESEPFSDRWRYRYNDSNNFEEAIEKIVSTQNIITHNLSTIDDKQLQFLSSQQFIKYSDVVILLTRKNFLDWITSMAVSLHENNYHGNQYRSTEKIEIEHRTFKYWFAIWYVWHIDEVPRYVNICKENNVPVIVGDYNRLTKIEGIYSDILPFISKDLDKSLFKISTVKQKTKTNSDYISNYDQIVHMYNSLNNRSRTNLFEEMGVYIEKYRLQISKGMYGHPCA